MIARSKSREKGRGVNRVTAQETTHAASRRLCACLCTFTGQVTHLPRRERPKRRPKASHPSLPSFPESLLHQLALRGRIHTPKTPFARLVLRAGHFQKVAIERQVVSDWILERERSIVWTTCIVSNFKEHITESSRKASGHRCSTRWKHEC